MGYLAVLIVMCTLNGECGSAGDKVGILLTERAGAKELLASPNVPPEIVGKLSMRSVKVNGDFDWRANDKMYNTIDGILHCVEENWDHLVKAFDADQYCTTFRHDMSVRNYSVGGICRMIAIEALAHPYQEALPPTQGAWVRLSVPKVALRDDFAKWCSDQKRQGKPLWKLQVEMCDDTIISLAENNFVDTTKRQCDEAIERIRNIKKELQRTKRARLPTSILISDYRMRIDPEDAKPCQDNCMLNPAVDEFDETMLAFGDGKFDPDAGLNFHRARLCDPTLGNWLNDVLSGTTATVTTR